MGRGGGDPLLGTGPRFRVSPRLRDELDGRYVHSARSTQHDRAERRLHHELASRARQNNTTAASPPRPRRFAEGESVGRPGALRARASAVPIRRSRERVGSEPRARAGVGEDRGTRRAGTRVTKYVVFPEWIQANGCDRPGLTRTGGGARPGGRRRGGWQRFTIRTYGGRTIRPLADGKEDQVEDVTGSARARTEGPSKLHCAVNLRSRTGKASIRVPVRRTSSGVLKLWFREVELKCLHIGRGRTPGSAMGHNREQDNDGLVATDPRARHRH